MFNEKYKLKRLLLNDNRNLSSLIIPKINNVVKKEIKDKYGDVHFILGLNIIEESYDSKWGEQYQFYTIEELLSEKQDDITEILKLKEVTNG